MKSRQIIIVSILTLMTFAPKLRANADWMQNNIDDTTRIRLLNEIAFEFYQQSEFDSCLKYASKALTFSENLFSSEKVLNDPDLLKQSKVLKAKSLTNFAMGLVNSNSSLALDTLQVALLLMKEAGNKEGQADIYSTIAAVYDIQYQDEPSIKNRLLSTGLYRETGKNNKLAPELIKLAIIQRYVGKYGESLENLVESLKISRQTNDSATMVQSLVAMGSVYLHVEKLDDALKCQNDALRIYEAQKDSLGIAIVYNDMGVANMQAGLLDTALKHHQNALEIRLKSKGYYNIFSSYSYIGNIYEDLENYPEALRNYESGLRFAELTEIKSAFVDANLQCGMIHFKTADYDKAMEHFMVALQRSREIDLQRGEFEAARNIAGIYLARNETKKAISWFLLAEKAEPGSPLKFKAGLYRRIADSYFKIGDYKNAYINQRLYSQAKDSLVISENRLKIATMANRLEIENKQALQNEKYNKMLEIKQSELKRQKILRNFFIFGMFIILIMAVIFFIRFIEKKKLNTKLNSLLSNLKSTQSQLVHAEKMASLGELTAGIAHEIQNPLNFVNNFSEVNSELIDELEQEVDKGNLDEVKALAKDIRENEQKINHHGKRADAIVKGMLQHSRSSNGVKEPTDINALADEYLRLSYHGLRAKDKSFNADFKTDFDPDLPKIEVIPQEIGRVLINLINNAFYAVQDKTLTGFNPAHAGLSELDNQENHKPLVTVKTKKLKDKIEIRVSDNGNGIPDEIKDKIFQPFFTTKPTGEGTGLGLSLSYDIVKAHGGEIKVNSRAGEGTEFLIILPSR